MAQVKFDSAPNAIYVVESEYTHQANGKSYKICYSCLTEKTFLSALDAVRNSKYERLVRALVYKPQPYKDT